MVTSIRVDHRCKRQRSFEVKLLNLLQQSVSAIGYWIAATELHPRLLIANFCLYFKSRALSLLGGGGCDMMSKIPPGILRTAFQALTEEQSPPSMSLSPSEVETIT